MITLSAADQKLFDSWSLDRINLHIAETTTPELWVSDSKLADVLVTYGVDRLYALAAIRCATWRLGKYLAMVNLMTDNFVDGEMGLKINEITMLPVFSLKVTVENTKISKEKLLEIDIVCDFVQELKVYLEEDGGFGVTSVAPNHPYHVGQVYQLIELAAGINIPQCKVTPTSLTVKNFESSYPNEELGTPGIGVLLTATFTFPEGVWVIESA